MRLVLCAKLAREWPMRDDRVRADQEADGRPRHVRNHCPSSVHILPIRTAEEVRLPVLVGGELPTRLSPGFGRRRDTQTL